MATQDSTARTKLRRYDISMSGHIRFCEYRTRGEAWLKREIARLRAPHLDWHIVVCDLSPNQMIRHYGIDEFDKILNEIGNTGLQLMGTRAELIRCGVAHDYMFEQLGKHGQRSGPTEYGDNFRLQRLTKDSFKLTVYLSNTARNPYGMSKVDPYETDISDILERIAAPR